MQYRVSAYVTISMSTDVDAGSEEEAIKIAQARQLIGLCAQCAKGDPDKEWVTDGELDGEPEMLEVEEI